MQPRGRVWVPVPAQPLLPGSDFGNDFGILKSSIADGLWVAITKGNENNAAKAEGEFMFDSYCVVKACEPDSFLWHSCVYQQNKFLEWGWFNLYRAVVITKSRLCRLVSLSANCGKFSEGLGEVQKCIKKKKNKALCFPAHSKASKRFKSSVQPLTQKLPRSTPSPAPAKTPTSAAPTLLPFALCPQSLISSASYIHGHLLCPGK